MNIAQLSTFITATEPPNLPKRGISAVRFKERSCIEEKQQERALQLARRATIRDTELQSEPWDLQKYWAAEVAGSAFRMMYFLQAQGILTVHPALI